MWSPNCLPELLFTIPSFAELVFQAPPNAFRCPAALQMPSPPCHDLRLRLSCRCGAPIASELPYACLPGAAQSHFPIAFHLFPGCLRDYWSSKCLFICFPSLYMSPCVPCPALHLPPFTSNGRKPLGFNFQKLGGITASPCLRICAPGSGKLGTLSPTVSPSVSPPLSSTLSLT